MARVWFSGKCKVLQQDSQSSTLASRAASVASCRIIAARPPPPSLPVLPPRSLSSLSTLPRRTPSSSSALSLRLLRWRRLCRLPDDRLLRLLLLDRLDLQEFRGERVGISSRLSIAISS